MVNVAGDAVANTRTVVRAGQLLTLPTAAGRVPVPVAIDDSGTLVAGMAFDVAADGKQVGDLAAPTLWRC